MLSKEIQELQDLSELEQIKVGQQLLEDKEFVLFKWVFVHLKGFQNSDLLVQAAHQNSPDVCNLWFNLEKSEDQKLLIKAFAPTSKQEMFKAFEYLSVHLNKKQREKLFMLSIQTQNKTGFKILLPLISNTDCLFEAFKEVNKASQKSKEFIQASDFMESNLKSMYWNALKTSDLASLKSILNLLLESKQNDFLKNSAMRIIEKGDGRWELFLEALPLDGRAHEIFKQECNEVTSPFLSMSILVLTHLEKRALEEHLPTALPTSKLRL